jgi:hypothetical protein
MMIHDKISLPCWLFGFKMLIETILRYGGAYVPDIYIYEWRIEEGNIWPAGDERVRDVHAFFLWWFCHLALHHVEPSYALNSVESIVSCDQ